MSIPKPGKRSLSYYKTSFDIGYFLQEFGDKLGENIYLAHPSTTVKHRKFKKVTISGDWIDTLGCYQGRNGNYYINSFCSGSKPMSIFDFLIKEFHLESDEKSLKKVLEYLRALEDGNFINSSNIQLSQGPSVMTLKDQMEKYKRNNAILPYMDMTYLLSRGISSELLQRTELKDSLRNIKIYSNKHNCEIVNTAFVMRGSGNYRTYSLRNSIEKNGKSHDDYGIKIDPLLIKKEIINFKGMAYDKFDALFLAFLGSCDREWVNFKLSNLMPGDVDIIALSESGIDFLSFYQLRFDELKNMNVLGISAEGNPSHLQSHRISKVVKYFLPKKILLTYDDDVAGHKYSLDFLFDDSNYYVFSRENYFKLNTIFNDVLFSFGHHPSPKTDVFLIFNPRIEGQDIKFLVQSFVEKLNEELKLLNFVRHEVKVNDEGGFSVEFKKSALIVLLNLVCNNEFQSDKLMLILPELNDFNNDLNNK